jgi:hypothetical protein
VTKLAKTYEEEIKILKKKQKESQGFIAELQRSNVQKEGEI